ncbi:MAG: hypothetical protein ACI9MC_003732 [Kiritimatiellia bacterium]|jgi:hypothetical protein
MIRLVAIASILFAATACVVDEAGETLLVPADVEVQWDGAFNAVDDGLGVVFPVDIMVYDGVSGEPHEGVTIDVQATGDAYVLTDAELVLVDPEDCAGCTVFWDSWRDQYYALDMDIGSLDSARHVTGAEGLTRVFVLVDSFSNDGAGYAPITVSVASDRANERFQLVAR